MDTNESTPFDCLRWTQVSSNVLGLHGERLATMFHRLGNVLFELGRGEHYRNVFRCGAHDERVVLQEIEKIQFGRLYRDLVKVFLTGNLHAASEINIDTQFSYVVIEK